MNTAPAADVVRSGVMPGELRLLTIKTVWPAFAEQADKKGWPAARFLSDIAEHELAERDHMRDELTSAALMIAIQRERPAAGLICHSDRGSQYAAEAYRKQLAEMKPILSMSRTGWCYDCEKMSAVWRA